MARRPLKLAAALVLALTASGCTGKAEFNGTAAMTALQRQVAFGPRVPGTPGHDACRDYLVDELKKSADSVQVQHFD